MANRLKMAIHDAILQLHALHWSQRRIAQELGIDRATVGRHLRRHTGRSNAAIPPTGMAPPNAATFSHPPAPDDHPADARCLAATAPDANAAIPPAGSEPGIGATTIATGPTASAAPPPASDRGRPSLCEPFRAVIAEKVEQGLSAQRIFQDLAGEHRYGGAYDSVKALRSPFGRRSYAASDAADGMRSGFRSPGGLRNRRTSDWRRREAP